MNDDEPTLRDFFAGCVACGMMMRLGTVDVQAVYTLADQMVLARESSHENSPKDLDDVHG